MSAIGTGAIQVAVVALLAMSATAVLGASPAVATNAGIAAVLIATVQPAHGFYSPAAARRLVDVLIGGATSLAVLVLLPAHSPSPRTISSARSMRFGAALERTIDLGDVNGRSSLNNVSLGIYADAVRQAGYRDAKLRTLLETAPESRGALRPRALRVRIARRHVRRRGLPAHEPAA